jgi:hypothetical protein
MVWLRRGEHLLRWLEDPILVVSVVLDAWGMKEGSETVREKDGERRTTYESECDGNQEVMVLQIAGL